MQNADPISCPFLKLITHLSVSALKPLTEEVNDVDRKGVCLLMNLKRVQ